MRHDFFTEAIYQAEYLRRACTEGFDHPADQSGIGACGISATCAPTWWLVTSATRPRSTIRARWNK